MSDPRARRRLVAVATTAVLAGTMAATPAVAQDPADLSFMNWFYGGVMGESYDGYIASFLAEHPEVRRCHGGDPALRPLQRRAQRQAGGEPAAERLVDQRVGRQAVRGLRAAPRPDALHRGDPDYDLADFGDAALAPWQYEGKQVALPFTNAGNVVFYNKAIFEAAGVPTPLELLDQGKWTWDNLKATAKAITDATGQYGFVHNNNPFVNGFRTLVEITVPTGRSPGPMTG